MELVYETDIEDADVWIAKAALLGIEIRSHHKNTRLDKSIWRYGAYSDRGTCMADWPGRAAKMMVELLTKEGTA